MRDDDTEKISLARVGTVINGKWTVDRLIGVGGMASVYAATHRNAKRAALKIMHPELSAQTTIRERFLREGYLSNMVDHPGVVKVDDDGRLQSAGRGDTHVIVLYDNGVTAVPVMRPVSDAPLPADFAGWGETPIDQFIAAKLRKLGIVPAERCTDAEFLRRVSIELTGTLPTTLPEGSSIHSVLSPRVRAASLPPGAMLKAESGLP